MIWLLVCDAAEMMMMMMIKIYGSISFVESCNTQVELSGRFLQSF